MAALETLVVAALVAVSAGYSVWRLTPARFHLRAIDVLGRLIGDAPGGWLAGLRNRELARLGGSCGACASSVKLKVHGRGPKASH